MWIILRSWNKCNEFSFVSVFNVHAQCININHNLFIVFLLLWTWRRVCGAYIDHQVYWPSEIQSDLALWDFLFFFCFNHILHFLTIEHSGMFSVVQVQHNFADSSGKIVSLDLKIYNKRKCYQHKFMRTFSCVLHTNIPPILYQGKQLRFFFLLGMR